VPRLLDTNKESLSINF